MYLATCLDLLHVCIHDEKKRLINTLLLTSLFSQSAEAPGGDAGLPASKPPTSQFMLSVQFVFDNCLADMHARATTGKGDGCCSRAVSMSFPIVLLLMQRLTTHTFNDHVSSALSRIKCDDWKEIGGAKWCSTQTKHSGSTGVGKFNVQQFSRELHCGLARIVLGALKSDILCGASPHVLHPVLNLVGEVLVVLKSEENPDKNVGIVGVLKSSAERSSSSAHRYVSSSEISNRLQASISSIRGQGDRLNLSPLSVFLGGIEPTAGGTLEPDESTIIQLIEMGFDREHVLEAIEETGSNRVEIAMEYVLTHPPPSAEAIASRRAEREQQRATRDAAVRDAANREVQPAPGIERNQGSGSGPSPPPLTEGATRNEIDVENDKKVSFKKSESEKQELVKSDAEAESERLQAIENKSAKEAADYLIELRSTINSTAFNLIESGGTGVVANSDGSLKYGTGTDDGQGFGDGISEAISVTVSSFLMEICQKDREYRNVVVLEVLRRLKSSIIKVNEGYAVNQNHECSFSSVCHATVLLLRALPRTRHHVLRLNLVGMILSCIKSAGKNKPTSSNRRIWPRWLSSALLLLDVMAQPTTYFEGAERADTEQSSLNKEANVGNDEYCRVHNQRRAHAALFSKTTADIFEAVNKVEKEKKEPSLKPSFLSNVENPSASIDSPKKTTSAVFPTSFVAYTPLMTSEDMELCMFECLRLLRCRPSSNSPPAPGLVHSALLLLARVTRSNRIAMKFLKLGGFELILLLPPSCSFVGNSGLVTVILRHILEDDSTLQTAMEVEIRGTIARLFKRREKIDSNSTSRPKISAKLFVQVMTPLMCRDPIVFLKAAANSVMFDCAVPSTDSKISDSNTHVTLLTSEERYKHSKAISSIGKHSTKVTSFSSPSSCRKNPNDSTPKYSKRQRSHSKSDSKARGKSPHSSRREISPKRCKKEKDKGSSYININGSTANHTISYIFTHMVKLVEIDKVSFPNKERSSISRMSFLSVGDCLDVLSDMVLAVPACAAVIHRYRDNCKSMQNIQHALNGNPPPSPTAVSYLLHVLLPQNRSEVESKLTGSASEATSRKDAFNKLKVAQSVSRLLVSLCARAGEGRRRVISELSLALWGGNMRAKASTMCDAQYDIVDKEMWALFSWGELCLGLAAPRSSTTNRDSQSALSLEVVKLMLEHGMAHALLASVKRILNLHHPMSAHVAASLLRPFEIFTRESVVTSLEKLSSLQKNDSRKRISRTDSHSKGRRSLTKLNSQRGEGAFADDAMLDEEFNPDSANNAQRRVQRQNRRNFEGVIESMVHLGEDDVEMRESSDSDGDAGDNDLEHEIGIEDSQEESSDQESDSDDENSESEVEGSDEDTQDVDAENDESTEVSESSDDDSDDDEESSNSPEFSWIADEDGDFFAEPRLADNDEDENESSDGLVGEADGWTRIDNSELDDFGRFSLIDRHHTTSRQRSGFTEAAEDMIGNILRGANLNMDALNGLGIRLIPNRPRMDNEDHSSRLDRFLGGVLGQRNNATRMGELPTAVARAQSNVSEVDSLGAQPMIIQNTFGENPERVSMRMNSSSPVDSNFHFLYGIHNNRAEGATASCQQSIDSLSREELPIPANIDTRLFPEGPAAATHSRAQQLLHPLLSGIELPPVSTLFPALRPHGLRLGGSTDNSDVGPGGVHGVGDSSSNQPSSGNLLRLVTGPDGVPFLEQHTNRSGVPTQDAELRWSDDGQPLDGTTLEFRSAFERALEDSILRQTGSVPSDNLVSQEQISVANTSSNNGDEILSFPTPEQDSAAGNNEDEAIANEEPSGNSSEGDNVVSSLASGLRLSQNDNIEEANDETITEATAVSDNNNPRSEANLHGTEEEENVSGSPIENSAENTDSNAESVDQNTSNVNPVTSELSCPDGMDLDVFNSLPIEMQREVVDEHQASVNVANQLGPDSTLDPEALAALPEEMRNEIIAQEQRQRRLSDSAPADPSNAAEMDNASFIASLAPNLREEILAGADDEFLSSLPSSIATEAHILRERANSRHLRTHAAPEIMGGGNSNGVIGEINIGANGTVNITADNVNLLSQGRRRERKDRTGRIRVDKDRSNIVYMPDNVLKEYGPIITSSSVKSLLGLLYLMTPIRPHRLLHKLFENLSSNLEIRKVFLATFVSIVNNDVEGTRKIVSQLPDHRSRTSEDTMCDDDSKDDDFPPSILLGVAPELNESDISTPNGVCLFRRRNGSATAAAVAANLPSSGCGVSNDSIPPVVARRIMDTLLYLSRNIPRTSLEILACDQNNIGGFRCLDRLLDLITLPHYYKSPSSLEQLLTVLESAVAPLSSLPKDGENAADVGKKDIEAATAVKKEWIAVPCPVISQDRLKSLCSVLRLESCKDSAFQKVNVIARRLCRVKANRSNILHELGSVAQGLGIDALRDIKALQIQLNDAVKKYKKQLPPDKESKSRLIPASAVTLSSSSSEIKLLRVLQTLHTLSGDFEDSHKKSDGISGTSQELNKLFKNIDLHALWLELSSCLRLVHILEGVSGNISEEKDDEGMDVEEDIETNAPSKKLEVSVAGLLTRFLPTVESFFVVNSNLSSDSGDKSNSRDKLQKVIGRSNLVHFVSTNKVLLNALIRQNHTLLEKNLKSLVRIRECRPFLDFDIKRAWFKMQVRRLKKSSQIRNGSLGSLRLVIKRSNVFEESYHQLRLRNGDEMRGRLHITFRDEEGVDAGGLTREWFEILGKDMLNPNYALFSSTEDGCTFQPNPNSKINPDHLSYFRFVGRIVGKAVLDGFFMDAHFTRSLYKHMLGEKVTHHDMEAIDPEYYKNLKMILAYPLADIGVDLTFSTEDHSFGWSETIDLIPNGRNTAVTDENKEKYVSLICNHRMTTAIQEQTRAYLEGFHELVKPELVSIFNAKELELLISGVPDYDMHDLQKNTEYQHYKPSDPQIEWFWNIMYSLNRSEKAAFLQFVTGSSKVPLEGFSNLQGMRGTQKFSIHRAGGPSTALASAHTCFNALDLPVYTSEKEMREKLLLCIYEGRGGFLFA